jgi:hypothetical protein
MIRRAAAILAAAALVAATILSQPGTAGATAANKMVVKGSTTSVICTATVGNPACTLTGSNAAVPCPVSFTAGSGSGGSNAVCVQLLSGGIKTSSTVSLEITASVECSLGTNVSVVTSSTGSKTSSSATAGMVLWVVISNGTGSQIVPVVPGASAPTPPYSGAPLEPMNGMVDFCNRAIELQTSGFSTTSTITLLENTTNAEAFTWVSLPLNSIGSLTCTGGCTVSLVAAISGSIDTAGNLAMAVVTNRTLVVEPVNIANTIEF